MMKNKIRLSIIHPEQSGPHLDGLRQSAIAGGLDAEIVNLVPGKPLDRQVKRLGDAVIYRRSSLDLKSERASVAPYFDGKLFINETIFKLPYAGHKFFQQNMILANGYTKQYAIDTFRARNLKTLKDYIKTGKLKYPFIAKPNFGSRGLGIELIKTEAEFSKIQKINGYVFQNFIENDGDWRVIILGGRPLGAIRRVAKQGEYLNNISRGADYYAETDESVLSSIYDIAIKAASIFGLRFCGVDIIKDNVAGVYKILEVNTVPQWVSGDYSFSDETGVDVPDEIIKYVSAMLSRGRKRSSSLVEEYYKDNISYSHNTAFHFASRMWLWTGDDWSRKKLDELQREYIGENDKEQKKIIRDMVRSFERKELTLSNSKKFREKYFKRYPKLMLYNALFFKMIFAQSIYGVDIRPFIREHISDKELVDTFTKLAEDHDAIRVMSTHAINFFYLLKYYFRDKLSLKSMILADPYELIEISKDYKHLIENHELTKYEALKMRVYLLTHVIIGESRFYQRRVLGSEFKAIIQELEQIIEKNYTDISMDNKCEFLVCAKICGVKTHLKSIILSEARNSLSWAGNFIVDTSDTFRSGGINSLRTSEHRNVLFVMANRNFRAPKLKVKVVNSYERPIIGRLTRVDLKEFGISRVVSRVDTGATRSSMHCSDIYEKGGKLKFKLFDSSHPLWDGKEYSTSDYKSVTVRGSAGKTQARYMIKATVGTMGVERNVNLTLVDRKDMLYPVLLGRDFLRGQFIVDIHKQFAPERQSKI